MQTDKKTNPVIIIIIAVALIASVAVAIALLSGSDAAEQAAPATTTQEQGTNDEVGNYADGTYEATGEYLSPGGRESIELTVTLQGGQVVETSLTPNATSGESQEYQERFAANYKELVIGKSVDEISLTRVAGSSLTSNGFDDALEQIKEDAAA